MAQPVINFTPDPVQPASAGQGGAPVINFTPDPPGTTQAVQSNPSTVGSALADVANNSFVSSMNKAFAVPGKPNWNADAAENYIRSKLPNWLGGEPAQQSEQQQQSNQQQHPYASAAGSLTGHTLEAAPALMIPGAGETEVAADAPALVRALAAVRPAATNLASNAVAGALGDPEHPLGGAAGGAVLGGATGLAGKAIAGGSRKLIQAMQDAGLTPTVGTTNPLIGGIARRLAGAKDAMTKFGQKDLWQNAVGQFDSVPGASDIVQELQDSPSLQGVKDLQAKLYEPADASLAGTTITPKPTLSGQLSYITRNYAANTAPTVQDASVASFAQDIKNMSASGTLTGPNALGLYRNIRQRAFDATDKQTSTALLDIAGTLRNEITNVASDGGAALNQADQMYSRTKVLQDALTRSQGAQPSIQNMMAANKAAGAFSGNNGPLSDMVTHANEAYRGVPETTGRWGNVVANAVTEGLPAVAALASESSGHGAFIPYLLAKAAEHGASPLVGALANRTVTPAARLTLQQALARSLGQRLVVNNAVDTLNSQ